jgi:site-specific DNA recombinase
MMQPKDLDKFARGKAQVDERTNMCVIYTRVSTKEQADNNLSLETQRKACDQFAIKNNLVVKGYFGGTYESAKNDERKEFNSMLSFVKRSRDKISTIIVYSVDRFSRSGGNAIYITEQLKKSGVNLQAVTQPSDTSTPSGKLQQNIQFIFSEYDNQLRREKCVAGMKEAMQTGRWIGKAPYGYEIVRQEGKNKIVINEKGRIFKKAFEWKAFEKLSSAEISRKLLLFGLEVDERRIAEFMRNPWYCGYMSHKLLEGKLVKGVHEPLISHELFIKANIEVDKNEHGYSLHFENEPIPLKGFLKCNQCGEPMRGYVVKAKNLPYYKCNTKGCCNNKSGKELHVSFKNALEYLKLELLPNTKGFLKKQVIATYNKINREREENKEKMRGQIIEVNRKIERLEERFMAEEITLDLYQKYGNLYREELKKLEEAHNESGKRVSNLEKCIDVAFEMACNLHRMWDILTFKDRVIMQKVVFPEGIWYDKKINRCRTKEVNFVIRYFSQLSKDAAEIKSGDSNMIFEIPALVGTTGFEPVTPCL